MVLGGVAGYLVSRPGRGFLVGLLTTQLLASLAWVLAGNYPELVVYFLLPSLLAGGAAFLLNAARGCRRP
jgi:hypothetical protein